MGIDLKDNEAKSKMKHPSDKPTVIMILNAICVVYENVFGV